MSVLDEAYGDRMEREVSAPETLAKELFRDLLKIVSVQGPATITVYDVEFRARLDAIIAATRAESDALRAALEGLPSRVWAHAYHEFRRSGMSEGMAMARADVVQIETERSIAALAQPPATRSLVALAHADVPLLLAVAEAAARVVSDSEIVWDGDRGEWRWQTSDGRVPASIVDLRAALAPSPAEPAAPERCAEVAG